MSGRLQQETALPGMEEAMQGQQAETVQVGAAGSESSPTTPPAAAGDEKKPKKARRGIERRGKQQGLPVRATSFSVPLSLADAWKKRARRDGATQVDVMLTAVAEQRERLGELVREREQSQRASVVPTSDGIFLRQVVRNPSEPLVAVPLRMLSANVDILDGLAHEAGAESRSALVAAALEAWLDSDQQPAGAAVAHER